MSQEDKAAVAATHLTPFPAFTGRPRVSVSAEGQLVFRRPRWHSMFELGLVPLVLFQVLAHGLLPFAVAALLYWFCLLRRVTSVSFDRDTRLMTMRRGFLSLKRSSERSLADIHAVQVLTYPFMFTYQINLVFDSSSPPVIGLFSINNEAYAKDLARRIADFLGVPVFEERIKWL